MDSEQARFFTNFLVIQQGSGQWDNEPAYIKAQDDPLQRPHHARLVNVEDEYRDAQEEFILTNVLQYGMEDDHTATNYKENSTVYDSSPGTNPEFEQNAHENDWRSTFVDLSPYYFLNLTMVAAPGCG